MAKRKRLTPPDPDRISPVLETKSQFPMGVAPTRSVAPIADVARETAAQAALEEVTDTLTRAREDGRMVIDVPLSDIAMGYLMRDRLPVDDAEMDALAQSIARRGQQTPIEVAPMDNGRYGLISGHRRCRALKHLYSTSGKDRYRTVQALVRAPGASPDAYLAMVEENEVRVGLSYYERARIVARTADGGVFESEKQALQRLFASASRAKRSKIKSFLSIVNALDEDLRFPQMIGERMGLQLAKALDMDPDLAGRISATLKDQRPKTAEAELAILSAALSAPKPGSEDENQSLNKAETPLPTPMEIAPGLALQVDQAGTLSLSGPAVDDAFRDRLIAWLKSGAQ